MRKVVVFILTVLSVGITRSEGQSKLTASALLNEAISDGSLESEGVPAFKAEANFLINDYLGQPMSSGSLTVNYLKPGFRSVDTSKGEQVSTRSFTADELAADNYMQHLLVDLLLHPGAAQSRLQTSKLKEEERKLGQLSLRCISLDPMSSQQGVLSGSPEVDCLSSDKPMIRLVWLEYGFEVIFNNFVQFARRTFAREITIQEKGRVRAKLTVTKLTLAPDLTEANMQEKDALQIMSRGGKAEQSGQHPKVIKTAQPVFPEKDRAEHRSGAVYMQIVIKKDGSVGTVGIISAPSKSLAEASQTAVKQWKFWPVIENGEPVEKVLIVNTSFATIG